MIGQMEFLEVALVGMYIALSAWIPLEVAV